jgi:uncharacterized protein
VLLIVPPSETKTRAPASGEPVDLEALSFPALADTRRRVIDGLVATSARPDALRRLFVRPSFDADVARNTALLDLATRPAADVYTGPLHAGLDLAGLSAEARALAERLLVINSALWGLLRPSDQIPTYRLTIHAHLVTASGESLGRLDLLWRRVLPRVLAEETGGGLVVDLRSSYYQATGGPTDLEGRTVTLRVEQRLAGHRMGDVVAKRVRGQAAHELLEAMAMTGADPHEPDEVAAILGERWPVDLEPPGTRDRSMGWTLTIFATD